MVARKCDICGDLYEVYGSSTTNANSISFGYSGYAGEWFNVGNPIDCCPACMATIEETIKMLEDNKRE